MAEPSPTPVSALLSQALVAFTIECDNEFEHRMPHRTARYGRTPGARHTPWLISRVMWANCLRFLDERGLPLRELIRQARTETNLAGMTRWGHVTVTPDPADPRPKPPEADQLVRATRAGLLTREVWAGLDEEVEQRWRDRFGDKTVDELRTGLSTLVSRLDPALPDCMPILHYGLLTTLLPNAEAAPVDTAGLPLPVLLSRALIAFAVAFEAEAKFSLAIAANIIRVLTPAGVRNRDLPRLSGVSKESIAMAMGILDKRRLTFTAEETAGSRVKVVRLTKHGEFALDASPRLTGKLEADFDFAPLRAPLERMDLFAGLQPYPDGWRAATRPPTMLPHFPMVLHRGGYPDGS